MATSTDRITKTAILLVPIERAWRAISDAEQFGAWFGAQFDGPFVEGARLTGRIVPTTMDAEVASLQEPHAGTEFIVFIERVEPMRLFSFRWHPYAIGEQDYTSEPTTLVEFALQSVAEGTMLTVTESGFDRIPLERRAQAFASNEQGWVHQLALVAKYLAKTT